MLFILLANSWLLHVPQIILMSSGLFGISRVPYFIIFISQLHPHLFLEPTLIPIGPVIRVIVVPPLVFVFFLEILLYLGVERNKL
jgi:hypothetical protein